MSFSENSNDSDWNISCSVKKKRNIKGDAKKSSASSKENRKFCEKWLNIFSPWLTRCEDDPNRPFCRACQRPLDNNRFRLQRHERTAKHARNQEILLNEGEEVVRMCLNRSIKSTKKFGPSKASGLEIDHKTKIEPEIPFKQKLTTTKGLIKSSLEKDDRDSPYMFTKREYHDMNDYYYASPPSHSQHFHQSSQPTPQNQQHQPPPQPKKDSFDMFFEAISATVKNLPPKLAAEVKSRVSQVIAEFELRAICEKEAQEKAQQQSVITIPTQVTNVVTIDPVITTGTNLVNTNTGNQQTISESPSSVTQYVYTYQQKKEIN